ncbi:MAG: phosphomannomutase [Armatimonadota bacterium]|jgi:phosphomannomutase/phosphomannomutase/phosphoglucomutase
MRAYGESIPCFGTYDIRGRVPDELNEGLAYDIARAYAAFVRPRGPVAVGQDVRLSSPAIAEAVIRGLNDAGVDTLDIGLCGTEMVYFAAAQPGRGGGVMVTASHNPPEYNGMKLVREQAIPVSADTGLRDIESMVLGGGLTMSSEKGVSRTEDVTPDFVDKVLSFIDADSHAPLHIVANSGNGCAGPILDVLAERLPLRLAFVDHEPDGTFPHGVPNPILRERRARTVDAVRERSPDLGVAWDTDFDRCFFFDEKGDFVESYYLVGLLAQRMLQDAPGNKIVHDPRLVWNTLDIVRAAGGTAVQCRSGHTFIKDTMRTEDALYGGEMSAHHFFRDFYYCDSGMVPWLIVASVLTESGRSMSDLVGEREEMFPCSGEFNEEVADQEATIARVREHYEPQRPHIDETDGLSITFDGQWRFNIRASGTEPLLRLNVESHGSRELLQEKTGEVLALIRAS